MIKYLVTWLLLPFPIYVAAECNYVEGATPTTQLEAIQRMKCLNDKVAELNAKNAELTSDAKKFQGEIAKRHHRMESETIVWPMDRSKCLNRAKRELDRAGYKIDEVSDFGGGNYIGSLKQLGWEKLNFGSYYRATRQVDEKSDVEVILYCVSGVVSISASDDGQEKNDLSFIIYRFLSAMANEW